MHRSILALLALLALLSGVRADQRGYYQLWQLDGWSLADLEELDAAGGPALATRYPASIDESGAWRVGLGLWHRDGTAALGDGRPGVLDAPALPRAAGVAGSVGPVSLRGGYVQRFSLRERISPADSSDAAEFGVGDWNSHLDAWTLQAAVPLELPLGDGRRLAFRAGGGLEWQRLFVDQLSVQRQEGALARRIGLSARMPLPKRLELQVDYGWEDSDGFVADFTALFPGYPPSTDTVRVYGRPPEVHHVRATLFAPGGWSLSARLHQTLWSRLLLGYRDRTEAGLVLGRTHRGGFSWQLGATSSGQDARGESGAQDAWFLLAGLGWRRGPFEAALKIADDRWLGGVDWRKQTRLQLDLGWRATQPR